MNPVIENIITITDCFTGADGGIAFVKLKMFLEHLERDKSNDENSQKMLDAVDKLAKLITVLSK